MAVEMFIADTHFGHENILKECRREFSSIDEMDACLIDNINSRMTRADTLYILGDFSYRAKRPVSEYLEAIKPKKVLILGNHDESWLKKMPKEEIEREAQLPRCGASCGRCHGRVGRYDACQRGARLACRACVGGYA